MGSIGHFFCVPKCYGCLREKYSWDCVSQELKKPFFLMEPHFQFKEELTSYGYSDSVIWQIFSQR